MEIMSLIVHPRTPGKRYAKESRRKGMIPVNIYGAPLEKNIAGSVERPPMIKALLSPMGRNTLIKLQAEGKEILAIPREIGIDPVKNSVRHIDFLALDENKPITVNVPLIKEGRSQGEILGGRALVVLREVPVKCLPTRIPEKIVVDVTPLEIGGRVMLYDLPYPEGVTPAGRENVPVIVVNKGRGQAAEETTAAEGEAKPAEGAAKPAEGAAKPADGGDKKTEKKK